MRTHIIDNGPNLGSIITINQDFLFRGTNYLTFRKQISDKTYCGSEDEMYGMSTFVALNIEGVIHYGGGYPIACDDCVKPSMFLLRGSPTLKIPD
ncbi:hypothetical protein HZA96_07345 [Candidatus Woesearchaeota archaeon]|nr:hypothetical protein [Candidatus Woesearchaeota archaeon]